MPTAINIYTPGRICLFGDHQDYLGLPVIACAFNRGITLSAQPIDAMVFEIDMPDINTKRTIQLGDTYQKESSRDYFISALEVVAQIDCVPSQGHRIEIIGNLPINAGVSSSSAVVVSWIHFLLKVFGCNQEITPTLIGELAYKAEVLEFREPGGKMDQYTCSIGGLVYLETGSQFSCTPIETSNLGMVIGNSGLKKQTLTVLSEARSKAESAITCIRKEHPDFLLEEIRVDDISMYAASLSKDVRPFFEAAVINHEITRRAKHALEQTPLNMVKLGEFMTQHHNILRDMLHITVPTIDLMIESALKAGAYGAKIVGSGGGGCIVVLASEDKKEAISKAMLEAGAVEALPANITNGTRMV